MANTTTTKPPSAPATSPSAFPPAHVTSPAEAAKAGKADVSLAEKQTKETQERRERQAAGIEDYHYLQSQADNERAQIEERVEEQAAAKRHPATGETVLVAGVPPRPDMAVDEPVDESHLSENTKAEMMAGREALKSAGKKSEAEQAAGRKALKDRADSHPHKPYTEE